MRTAKIITLIEVISDIVNEEGPWKIKLDAILAEASEGNKIELAEFASWFNEESQNV